MAGRDDVLLPQQPPVSEPCVCSALACSMRGFTEGMLPAAHASSHQAQVWQTVTGLVAVSLLLP